MDLEKMHQPGCVLHPVNWLRHAVAAAGHMAAEDLTGADRVAAAALTDALAHFAEMDSWASVTLADIAEHATLVVGPRYAAFCGCPARPGGID